MHLMVFQIPPSSCCFLCSMSLEPPFQKFLWSAWWLKNLNSLQPPCFSFLLSTTRELKNWPIYLTKLNYPSFIHSTTSSLLLTGWTPFTLWLIPNSVEVFHNHPTATHIRDYMFQLLPQHFPGAYCMHPIHKSHLYLLYFLSFPWMEVWINCCDISCTTISTTWLSQLSHNLPLFEWG